MSRAARLLIVWHSRTGATEHVVEAMTGACREFAVELVAIQAHWATAHDLQRADAVLFACPENLGSMSGAMKEFFDRCYYDLLDQLSGKAYGIVIVAGSDGTGALRQLERIATGLRLRAISAPVIIITHAQSKSDILAVKRLSSEQIHPAVELAQTLAAGLAAGIY